MSRHRNIRNRAYSYDDDDYYDDYDYDAPDPPSTSSYVYARDSPRHHQTLSTYVTRAECGTEAVQDGDTCDAEILQSQLPLLQEILHPVCIKKAHLIQALRHSNYDIDEAAKTILLDRAATAEKKTQSQSPVGIKRAQGNPIERMSPTRSSQEQESLLGSNTRKDSTNFELKETEESSSHSTSTKSTLKPRELAQYLKAEHEVQKKCLEMLEKEKSEANYREKVNLIIIGHVDAGKSTIIGHLMYRLGNVSQKTMHKYKKEAQEKGKASFHYAWITDADETERSRGVTIDVGVCHFQTTTKLVTILDAPGHKDFIPNMIAGASQADVAMLVVPAPEGEFDAAFNACGQTKEHTLIVRSLGITQMIIVINKMDKVAWSQERFDTIQKSLGAFLQSCGFRPKNICFVPVSGISGANLDKELSTTECAWYSESTLLQSIDNVSVPMRPISAPFRMGIVDVYKSSSFDGTVSGRIYTGAISVGSTVLLMPANEKVTVKGLEQSRQTLTVARAGDTVELGLGGVDPSVLFSGSILCSMASRVHCALRFEAKILTMPAVLVPLLKGTSVTLHLHYTDEPAVITQLISLLDKTGEVVKKRPRCITRDKSANIQLTCQRPICLELFSEFRALGRFTLRDRGSTLAAGIVTKIIE